MPEYQGVNLKDVPVESDLFEGYKFSKYRRHLLRTMRTTRTHLSHSVVSSDPKSRTGAEDKKALLQMYVSPFASHCTVLSVRQDPRTWWQVCPVRS